MKNRRVLTAITATTAAIIIFLVVALGTARAQNVPTYFVYTPAANQSITTPNGNSYTSDINHLIYNPSVLDINFLVSIGGVVLNQRDNVAAGPPTANNDYTQLYGIGSQWYNTLNNFTYTLTNPGSTPGNATWAETISGAISIGSTAIIGGSSAGILYNNAGYIGNSAAIVGLVYSSGTGAPVAYTGQTLFSGIDQVATGTVLSNVLTGYGTLNVDYPQITFRAAGGSLASPTAMTGGGVAMGGIYAQGWNGSTFSGNAAGIEMASVDNFTTGQNGAEFLFYATPSGTTTATNLIASLTGNGLFTVGNSSYQGYLGLVNSSGEVSIVSDTTTSSYYAHIPTLSGNSAFVMSNVATGNATIVGTLTGTGFIFSGSSTEISSISGNTQKVATTAGTLTNGHCVEWDVNGNAVDAGAACSSGGGGGSVVSVGFSVPGSSLFGVSGSPITTSGTLGLTTTGTAGGLPYFSSTSVLSASGAITGLVYNNGASGPAAYTGQTITSGISQEASGTPLSNVITNYGATSSTNYGEWTFKAAEGSLGSPAAIQYGDTLGGIYFQGHNGSGFTGNVGGIEVTATQNFTTGQNGAEFLFYATPLGSTTSTNLIASLTGNGDFTIGNSTNPGTVQIYGTAGGSFSTELESAENAGNRILYLPITAGGDTIATLANTQTLLHTTLNGGTLSGNTTFPSGELTSAGALGIGITNPFATLDVNGDVAMGGSGANLAGTVPSSLTGTGQTLVAWNYKTGNAETDFITDFNTAYIGGIAFFVHNQSGVTTELMYMEGNGNTAINGELDIGSTTPSGQGPLRIHAGTNEDLLVRGPIDLANGTSIYSVNDANSVVEPLELAATEFYFTGGDVLIGTTVDTAKLTLYAPSVSTSSATYAFDLSGAQSVATTGEYYGLHINPTANHSSGTVNEILAASFGPTNVSTGTVTYMYSGNFNPQNTSTGLVNSMYGFNVEPENTGGGTVSSMWGGHIQLVNAQTYGVVTSGVGLEIDAPSGTFGSYSTLILKGLVPGTAADTLCLDSLGNVLAQASSCTISSLRFKNLTSIQPNDSADLNDVMALNPIEFTMKSQAAPNPDINFSRPQIGIAAENVAAIDKKCAIFEQDGTTPKSYRPECIVALLVGAVHAQQREIVAIRTRNP